MFFFCNVWSYPWILTCHSLTFNCSTVSFTYCVIFFLSLVLFHSPLSVLLSGTPCLPITSTFLFHFLSFLIFPPSLTEYLFLLLLSSQPFISLVFLCIPFHFLYYSFISFSPLFLSFPFSSLIYTVITAVWDSLVYLIIKLLIWIVPEI